MKVNPVLFEISWEVCNKIGGIFTVIESKTPYVSPYFENHYLIGPYVGNSKNYFEEIPIPSNFLAKVSELETMGIKIHFGTWDIRGKKDVILVEHLGYADNTNNIKGFLWEKYKIDSLGSQWYDYDEAMLWSWCCGIVIEKLSSCFECDKILVQAHEWMSGAALFYLDSLDSNKFRTIFTTHATMLGRSIAGSGHNLYELKNKIDPEKYSYKMGVHTKHQTEKALAQISHCFTTVSDITNEEAQVFYSKPADILLYNGFDNSEIKEINSLDLKFSKEREKTETFINAYFRNNYEIDIDKTRLFYTSGRNEFRNKGFDLYIKALSRLNQKLKQENSEISVINFFLVMVGDFKASCSVAHSEENCVIIHENSETDAPLSTHAIKDHDILTYLKNYGLKNNREDKVRNIFVPMELNGKDGVIDRKYFDFISGFDLSIFVSYYEPWGYTPLESISYAIPTITSDLAGFGKNVLANYGNSTSCVKVLKRENSDDETSAQELCDIMYKFIHESKTSTSIKRQLAKRLALKYDWSVFISNYIKAFDFALGK